MAATFLGRRKDSKDSTLMRVDTATSASQAALEDLYVVHSDGLLLRHRLQVGVLLCISTHLCLESLQQASRRLGSD